MTDDMTFDSHSFDPTDTELVRRFDAAAPPAGDADSVLAGLRPRLTRARRRRQAGMLAVGAAALVLFAGVAFAATDPDHDSRVRVPPATRPPATVETGPAPTTPTTPMSTNPTAPVTTPDGRATSPTSPATSPPTGAATPPTAPATPPTTVDDHGSNRGPGSTNSGPGSGSSGSGSSGMGSSGSGSSGTN